MALNQAELDALATATALAKAGTGLVVDDEAKRATCDGLVQSGHLIEVEDVEGGYTLSEEFAKAMLINTAQKTEQAKDN